MTRLLTLLSATLLLLNACCPVTSEHPLSGPADSVYDRNLAGTWKSDDGELFFHIGKGEGNRVKVIAVEHGSDTKMDAAIFSILTTAVKKEHYLSIDLAALPKKNRLGLYGIYPCALRFSGPRHGAVPAHRHGRPGRCDPGQTHSR